VLLLLQRQNEYVWTAMVNYEHLEILVPSHSRAAQQAFAGRNRNLHSLLPSTTQ